MDDQLFYMLKDRFDRQDDMLSDIKKKIDDHTKIDEQYWKKIDVQEGQMGLLKWLFGSTITTLVGSCIAWLITNAKG